MDRITTPRKLQSQGISRRGTPGAAEAAMNSSRSHSPATVADARMRGLRLEPKSEFLRKTLQDLREARSLRSPTVERSDPVAEPSEYCSVHVTEQTDSPDRDLPSPEPSFNGDEWTNDIYEDERYKTPRKARRSSTAGLRSLDPSIPSRDTQTRIDRLSNENFNLKHRLTLQQEQVKDLNSKLESALKEIEALRKSEEQKEEKNRQLEEDVGMLLEQIDSKDDIIGKLFREKDEVFALNDELMKTMEKKDEAIAEAGNVIMDAEDDLQQVQVQLEALATQHAALLAKESELGSQSSNKTPERRARLKESIESKLSATHSDYYSGQDTPSVRVNRNSPPRHLIPTEFIPQRQYGPLAERMIRENALENDRIQEVRKRCSYASEATTSLANLLDNPIMDMFRSNRASNLTTVPSDDLSEEEASNATTSFGSPVARRNSGYRSRMTARGLRTLYQEGEQASRQERVERSSPAVRPSSVRPLDSGDNTPVALSYAESSVETIQSHRRASSSDVSAHPGFPNFKLKASQSGFSSFETDHSDSSDDDLDGTATVPPGKTLGRTFIGNPALKETAYPPFNSRNLFFNPNVDITAVSTPSPPQLLRTQSLSRTGRRHGKE